MSRNLMRASGAAIVAAIGLLGALPVGAVNSALAGAGVSSSSNVNAAVQFNASGSWAVVGGSGPGGLIYAFQCNAEAMGPVSSTSILACTLNNAASPVAASAGQISLPGNAAALASVANFPLAPTQVCWLAVTTPINDPTHPLFLAGCS